jgi:hypothetical protein
MAGLFIVYLLVLNSDEGANILDSSFGNNRCAAYIHALEILLMLENFCKQDNHDKLQLKIMKTGIPYIMETIKEVLNRTDGQGWKIPKFHLMTHFVDDIVRFGSMKNFDSATGERNHKTDVKDPAKHTQRQKDGFELQTAERYYENVLINLAATDMNLEGIWDKKTLSEQTETFDKCQNIIYCHDRKGFYKLKEKKYHELIKWKDDTLKQQLLQLCLFLIEENHVQSPIKFFTQHNRKSTIFRADPFFKDSVWYDWAYVDWDGYENPVPAKILLFVDLNDNLLKPFTLGGCEIKEKTSYALAYTFEDAAKVKAHGGSLLVDFGKLMLDKNGSPELCMFCLDSINSPCIAVPYKTSDDILNATEWMILLSRENWYNILLNHLSKFYEDNNINLQKLIKY